jgi:acid phosphatase type 7
VLLTTTGAAGEFAVSWVTSTAAETSESVLYGSHPNGNGHMEITARSFVFDDDGSISARRIHVARMTGLQPNVDVVYSLGGNATMFKATYAPIRPGGKVYAVLADLGLEDNYALPRMLADSAAGLYDAVVIGGDYAYDLEDDEGGVGDAFMDGLTPM